ncbi:hypothetical protein N7532_001969 [Penicillium argentinense]|uniref:Uncharacterized protein n=1 Tax=Penicillium argentinense TaxID=1131581 RepID=A0A9W9KLS2_9EURO|nr:uncharacterized protein N7532_001969 [Penicillium argentinense]KAJ5111434.1 hypothetical protein N7532_001969 [Penicillium argentinense]
MVPKSWYVGGEGAAILSYYGSLIFNLGSFVLPAIYSTLRKLWVSNIDSSQVVTTDIYTYISVIVKVLNESIPRSAWLVIGDNTTRTLKPLSRSRPERLDNPDVPLIIRSSKFIVDIVLDFLIISKFHVGRSKPTVVTQALIRHVCDSAPALVGLLYFVFVVVKRREREFRDDRRLQMSFSALKTLLGQDYATAWDVSNTVRWGLAMVPVEESSVRL